MYEQTFIKEKPTKTIQIINDKKSKTKSPEVVCITSYPERECGIATFSKDLRDGILSKFGDSIHFSICAIDHENSATNYSFPVEYILESSSIKSYKDLANALNKNDNLEAVLVQHEFGLFGGEYGEHILYLLNELRLPVITTFHTVLPSPTDKRKQIVQAICNLSSQVVVMTNNSKEILKNRYGIGSEKINIIPHGTHLVSMKDKEQLKEKYFLKNRKILTTFGLLNSGKGIETALRALPEITKKNPDCFYLIIGKTHPEILKREGETYRKQLQRMIAELKIDQHVLFVDKFVSNEEILEFLQMTDIYLFTSNDPFQAVSGTFAFAMGCHCPIISTQIPHAKDQLSNAGIMIDFNDSNHLGQSVNYLFQNPEILQEMRINALEKIRPSSWPNVAIKHLEILKNTIQKSDLTIDYKIPEYNLNHFRNSTNNIGIIQFSKIEIPDIESGFTLDDNARALIATSEYYELTGDKSARSLINTYFNFIETMQQDRGDFLNYLDKERFYTIQNFNENLEDSNGRALCALGLFYSNSVLFDKKYSLRIETIIEKFIPNVSKLKSPRSIAFTLKGLYYYSQYKDDYLLDSLLLNLAEKLLSFYQNSKNENWLWFENSITYGNAILSEALLYAYAKSRKQEYLNVAKESFDFLLSIHFEKDHFSSISNRTWYSQNTDSSSYGEQPIDVAYTILALEKFSEEFKHEKYDAKMKKAFHWFLGENHLKQIVYNPVTGGCCDGIEHDRVNLNQGAESTITYLLARNSIERKFLKKTNQKTINKTEI
jgi:glycosyltransferase involved in cell wall biosynthesis